MDTYMEQEKKGLLEPVLTFVIIVLALMYGAVAAVSGDPLWFLGGTSMPDPERIVIRVDGVETVLTKNSPGYAMLAKATRKALSSFASTAPDPLGLSAETIAEWQQRFTVLELYYPKPVDFRLPFEDGDPTALLIPIEGRHAGHNYVFRGKDGEWWSRPLKMSDTTPILDTMRALGYID